MKYQITTKNSWPHDVLEASTKEEAIVEYLDYNEIEDTEANRDMLSVTKAVIGKQTNGTIYYDEIKDKNRNRMGIHFEGRIIKGHKAIIMPNEYIRIFGQEWNHSIAPVDFDKTFSIGDEAEYNSYNLKYTGKIIAIGAKTVTIRAYDRDNHKINIYEFSWRNWDFDSGKIAKENAETMQYI